jgi:VIT1/CCC1 family predicted Fe2+/Mn2+ transporter
MALALLTLTIAQLFDLGTFVRMIERYGSASEVNPFVHFLLSDYGLPFVVVAKIAALSLVVAVIGVLAGRAAPEHPRLVGTVFAVAILAGLVGGWSNARLIL